MMMTFKTFVDLPDSSAVHGIVTEDGLFDGHISTPVEEYYIEPASRYFAIKPGNEEPSFHSVIYKASDVIHPATDGEVRVRSRPNPFSCPIRHTSDLPLVWNAR